MSKPGRPPVGGRGTTTVRITVRMPEELRSLLEAYRRRNGLENHHGAIRDLIERFWEEVR